MLVSCNVLFFVRKEKVIHEATGYLLYRRSECLFFKDEDLSDFFKKSKRDNGYAIYQGCGLESMKLLASVYGVKTQYQDQGRDVELTDTIRIVPVRIRYLPIKFKVSEKVSVVLRYNKTLYYLNVWDLFNGEVLSVDQMRKV